MSDTTVDDAPANEHDDEVPVDEHVDDPQPGDEAVETDEVPAEDDVRTLVEREPASVAVVPLVTSEAAELIRVTLNPDLTDPELMLFAAVCNRVGLDPFARQIYAVKRNDRQAPGGKRVTFQTGIDGFRLIARRTGRMAGRLGPYFCGEDGEWLRDPSGEPRPWLATEPPAAAMVGVVRHGDVVPTWAVARWKEFLPPDGQQQMWIKMPTVMLGKCAEAQATRAAFPAETSGLYVDEEMMQSDRPAIEAASATTENPLAVSDPDLFGEIRRRIEALPEDPKTELRRLWSELDEVNNPRLPPLARLLVRHGPKAKALVQSIEKRVERGEWGDETLTAWKTRTEAYADVDGGPSQDGQDRPEQGDAPDGAEPADGVVAPATDPDPEKSTEPAVVPGWSTDLELMQICVDEVRKLGPSDVVLAMQDRGLPEDGNLAAKRKALALALYLERGGTPPPGRTTPEYTPETPVAEGLPLGEPGA